MINLLCMKMSFFTLPECRSASSSTTDMIETDISSCQQHDYVSRLYLCHLIPHGNTLSLYGRMFSWSLRCHDSVSVFWHLAVYSYHPSSRLIKHSALQKTHLFLFLSLLVIMAGAMRCKLQCHRSPFSPVPQKENFFLKQRHQGEEPMEKEGCLSILTT
jgi:hypothetical protein